MENEKTRYTVYLTHDVSKKLRYAKFTSDKNFSQIVENILKDYFKNNKEFK